MHCVIMLQQVGFSILDLSKILMYEFHYYYIKEKYSETKLLFTDRQLVLQHSHRRHLQRHGTECSYFRRKRLSKGPFPTFHCEQEGVGKMKDEIAGFLLKSWQDFDQRCIVFCMVVEKRNVQQKALRVLIRGK